MRVNHRGSGKHRGLVSHGVYSVEEVNTLEEYRSTMAKQRVGGRVDEGE